MDATPPGEIQSRTTPLGIGQLRDPFGDEWRVTPPELTSHTLNTLRDLYLKQLRLEGEELFYSISAAQNREVVTLNVGDRVTIDHAASQEENSSSILDGYTLTIDSRAPARQEPAVPSPAVSEPEAEDEAA